MKGLLRTCVLPLVLVVGLAMGLAQAAGAAPSSAQDADQIAVVDAFHAAGDDMEAALALLTEDVVIDLCCPAPPNTPGVWKGKAEARAFFEWRNANNIRRVRAGDAQVASNAAGQQVTGNVHVDSDVFKMWGVGAVGHTFEVIVQDGKIKQYRGQILPEEAKRVAAARLAFEQARGAQATQPPAGMPRTGAPAILPLLMAFGTVMLAAGTALRRRKS